MSRKLYSPAEAYKRLAGGHLPPGSRVTGELDYSASSGRTPPPRFPPGLCVDVLNVAGCQLDELPEGLQAYELIAARTPLRSLPASLRVSTRLILTGCERLQSLPTGLTVGSLVLRGCTALRELPEGLDVWFLDLTDCWALERWPRQAVIRGGHLRLRGCAALRELPPFVRRLAGLDVSDCPNLCSLPPELVVTGWIDVAGSGLKEDALHEGVARAQLRWRGVAIDRRVAFHPETLTVGEVLGQRNAERRRVLIERYGVARLLKDARAKVLDTDRDAGGPRQLLLLPLADDEDIVALSCFCPSTGRQYMIRVPPTTLTCRQAAAWIAGFDDPADYQPLVET
ncbi:MAG: hypothetical protein K6T86_15760 [Pirellulales bacterium]|nr:hypothetical protein [Pirellulales bacterium]